ncbi:MAG: hypothetical protein KIT69_13245, partial [Propionibacteriaceae bacterium]|nr:hypothetical protein [Propionibacteriaceae bacterium]
SLQTDFELETRAGTTTLRLRNSVLRLGGTASAPVLTVSQPAGGTGSFVFGPNGVSGSLAVTLTFAAPGVGLEGAVAIEIDTNPAAPKLIVRGDDLELTVLGQVITADITFEQVTNAAGARLVRLGIADGGLKIGGTLASPIVEVTAVTGLFVLTSSGLAGAISGQVRLNVPQVEFVAGVQVLVNTTGSAVSQTLTVGGGQVSVNLPAGPYLRLEATGVTLKIAGQSLSGNIAIEQVTTIAMPAAGGSPAVAATTLTKIALSNVELRIGDGTRTIARLTGGNALLVLPGIGIAGRITGSFALVGVPGVALAATVAVEFNTTGGDVRHRFSIAGATTDLVLSGTDQFKVTGTALTLRIGGAVDLLADLTITQTGSGTATTTTVKVANGSIALAGGLVKAININGNFTISSQAVAIDLAAGLQVTVPGLAISGAVKVRYNTADAIPVFALTVTVATLTIGDAASPLLTVGASLVEIESVGTGAASEIRIALQGVTLQIAGPSGPIVDVRAGHTWKATLVVTAGGIAGQFSGNLAYTDAGGTHQALNIPGVELLSGTFSIQLNTSSAAIKRGAPFNLDIPAGPFAAVAMTGVELRIGGSSGITFKGNFLITSSSTETLIAFSAVEVQLGDGTSNLSIVEGRGAFLLLPAITTAPAKAGGVAGTFSGRISASSTTTFSAEAAITVRLNTSEQAVSRTITVGGSAITLNFGASEVATTATGPFVQFEVTTTVKIGNSIEISGTFSFGSSTPTTISNVTIFVGDGPGFNSVGGETVRNPLARGVYITNASGQAQNFGAGLDAFALRGTVELVGIPGITLAGTVTALYNTSGAVRTLTVGGTSVSISTGSAASPFLLVVGTGITIDIAGQKLTGSVGFQKSAAGMTLAVGNGINSIDGNGTTDVYDPLTLSFGGVAELRASGSISLTPTGVVAVLDGHVTLSIGTAPNRLIHLDADATLLLNSTGAVAQELGFTLAPRSVRVQVGTLGSLASLEVFGQTLTGVLVFSQVVGSVAPGAPPGTAPLVTSQLVVTGLTLEVGA